MPSSSLAPIAAKDFKFYQARHLLLRAGFGGNFDQINAIANLGLEKAVDYLVDYENIKADALDVGHFDKDIKRPLNAEEREMLRKARSSNDESVRGLIRARRNQANGEDQKQHKKMKAWWLKRMILTPRPLEEKLTLLWHGHFASRFSNVEDSYLMYMQNNFFRANANGNFAKMAYGIIEDPAMLVFLNNDKNLKSRPNENLAREIMELFTLGIGNYTEQDIKEGARALTGYTRKDNEFLFNPRQHDRGSKTILGKRGTHSGKDFVTILLGQRSCPQFIAYKLYKHFVADPVADKPNETQQKIIDQLAKGLMESKYELKPVLKTLFKSEHFYDDAVMSNKIAGPAEFVSSMVRMLETPSRPIGTLVDAMDVMGQELFNPPSVAGWPAGQGWINTSTLFTRQNLPTYLITGKLPAMKNWETSKIQYDAMQVVTHLKDQSPEAVVDHLLSMIVGPTAGKDRRTELLKFFAEHDNKLNNSTMVAALCLVTALPEAQLI